MSRVRAELKRLRRVVAELAAPAGSRASVWDVICGAVPLEAAPDEVKAQLAAMFPDDGLSPVERSARLREDCPVERAILAVGHTPQEVDAIIEARVRARVASEQARKREAIDRAALPDPDGPLPLKPTTRR